ncbi:hypothetical protein MKW98_000971 [Papaver atlanticum]|uniref:X8 domain-containing protein n=1 Tax=Papaver atlanticum TaxID=357466 RepID=A0AAD4SD37_9MAGN|nr:hypothetical protein MKW98_000971 [Papaver atlanticum]
MSRILFGLLFTMLIILQNSNGQMEEWCIADEQTPHDALQMALDWACGRGGADCSKIQRRKSCYNPNTLLDHASYAFNSYYQKFKKQGATCYFRSAAMITNLDPKYKLKWFISCEFE